MNKVRRALISVTNKEGIVEFAQELSDRFGIEIYSTGGTARVLSEAGIKVSQVEELTHFPEMMSGRVKTLHPHIHGGLLARRDNEEHCKAASDHNIAFIDMVVVNLYEFERTLASGADFATCIENIDIGGPSMLRSAAKNFDFVTVVSDPADYARVLGSLKENSGSTSWELRRELAFKVFATTSAYDGAITSWLESVVYPCVSDNFSENMTLELMKAQSLRYGENPHQRAAFYRRQDFEGQEHSLASATQHQGKELSYNNYLDLDAAWAAVREFEPTVPTCVIVKHLTPCGIAQGSSATKAYERAFECDPISAFGGVIAFNCPINAEVAQSIFENKHFVEAIIAPEMSLDFLEMYTAKPNVRLLSTGSCNKPGGQCEYRSVEGGILVQTSDAVNLDLDALEFPTKRKPNQEELEELLFAWRACKSIKSNAIAISKDKALIGSGGGQTNRVQAAMIAVEQAGDKACNACAASDAFFPFRDGLDVLAKAGVKAVIQPGGSVRDEEVIEAADEAGIAMVFTRMRHFKH